MLHITGHRGAKGLAPENTLASIRKALEYEVDEIEVDLRVSSDGIVFLHHDLLLRDQAGNSLNVRDHTYEELKRHKPDLATLAEAVRAIDRQVPLQLEVKWGEQTGPIIKELHTFFDEGWQATDFLIGSKKQQTLLELHQALPEIPKVVIEPYLSVRGTWRARRLGSRRISMNQLGLWSGFIRAMDRRGYEIHAYALNDPAKARRWSRYGLRGVITDLPDRYHLRQDVPESGP